MECMPQFSENLKRLMKEHSVSTRALTLALGIPSSTISEWTAGREPKLGDPVLKLAKFFGVSLEFLITGKEPEQEVIQTLLETECEQDFMTIHQGIYRVRLEKLKNKKGKT